MVQFIRAISRLHLDSNHQQVLREFCGQDVPWEQLILMAETEGVDGLLYHHLSRYPELRVSEPAKSRLAETFSAHRCRQEDILTEAECISDHLERNGMAAIALQGVSLLETYEIAGLRPMGDIDLLIKPDRYPYVAACLREIGFLIPHPAYPKNLRKGLLWLDMHTHILNLDRIRSRRFIFPEDLSDLWHRAHRLFKSSTGLLAPDPLDNFVVLCAHTLKHSYSRMIWLVDLYETLTRIVSVAEGWKKLIDRIRFWRQEKIVLYGLTVLEGILGFTVPGWVKDALDVRGLGTLEKYILKLRIKGVHRPEYFVLLSFLAIQGARQKWAFLYESMLPREEIMAQIYLDSKPRSRPHQIAHRLVRSLSAAGNGLKQAVSNAPFSRR